MFKKKEKIKLSPYRYLAKYCHVCGKILSNKREVTERYFDTKTGVPVEQVRYGRYCIDWQIKGHTVQWTNLHVEFQEQK